MKKELIKALLGIVGVLGMYVMMFIYAFSV